MGTNITNIVLSGHKSQRCLIYQVFVTPEGLGFLSYLPEAGRKHDLTLYREINWKTTLEKQLDY